MRTISKLQLVAAAVLPLALHAAYPDAAPSLDVTVNNPDGRLRGSPVRVDIDATHSSSPVSPYEYGMFIEPIGGLVARTLWAEMLDDRKFYYPIVAEGKDPPAPPSVEGRPGFTYRKWRPIGGDDAVFMDTHEPFVGAQCAKVPVVSGAARGFAQSGLALQKNSSYSGHIVLDGAAGVQVRVTLIWGSASTDRQSIEIPTLGNDWRSYPLEFKPAADSSDARLEITGMGSGQFRVGAISLMPADNLNGWRRDTAILLHSLHSGLWRLPGGNFLSDWDWHGAIGARDRRAPVFDYAWSAMQPNDLGLDEFLDLTRLIGVEPYVTVNAGLGDANSAAEEVEYLNGAATSDWGAKRAANGHPAPYAVHFWNIGNEPYGWWQIGKTTLEYFLIKQREFARAMRSKDPNITLIASGAMPDQMHARDAKENASLESIQPRFGTEQDWTGGLLAGAWGTFDGISEHWYDRAEKRPEAPPAQELIEFARSPSNQVRMKADEWAIYQQRFPQMRDKHIFLSMDEYAYIGAPANLKLSLAYATVLQEMLRHTDAMRMGAFTTGASTLDVTPTDSVINSTGEVFKFYGEHFGAGTLPLQVTGNAPQPEPSYAVGYDHPKVRAGSDTYPLDVIAGMSADRRLLRVGVVNATPAQQDLAIEVHGARLKANGRVWRLIGKTLQSANRVGQNPEVTIGQEPTTALPEHLRVPALSISIFEYRLGE